MVHLIHFTCRSIYKYILVQIETYGRQLVMWQLLKVPFLFIGYIASEIKWKKERLLTSGKGHVFVIRKLKWLTEFECERRDYFYSSELEWNIQSYLKGKVCVVCFSCRSSTKSQQSTSRKVDKWQSRSHPSKQLTINLSLC